MNTIKAEIPQYGSVRCVFDEAASAVRATQAPMLVTAGGLAVALCRPTLTQTQGCGVHDGVCWLNPPGGWEMHPSADAWVEAALE